MWYVQKDEPCDTGLFLMPLWLETTAKIALLVFVFVLFIGVLTSIFFGGFETNLRVFCLLFFSLSPIVIIITYYIYGLILDKRHINHINNI